MRKLIIFVSAALTWSLIRSENITESSNQLNKTKRGILQQTHYYGEPSSVKLIQTPVYQDSASSAASNPTTNYYANPKQVVFQKGVDNEPPKQVTVHQVLYEYQQTPHNAVSNVHVNQQFQTAPAAIVTEQKPFVSDTVNAQSSFASPALQATQINPHFVNQPHVLHVEPNQFSGVATPVHHGAVINHGQGYSKLYYGPITVGHTTTTPTTQHQHNGAAKYIYANGKIVYHPFGYNTHVNNPYPGITVPARSQNLHTNVQHYPQRPAPVVTQKPFRPSPLIPITHTRYQLHPIKAPVKPTEAPVKEEVEEEENDEKSDVREEDEEGELEDNASYEEEEDEPYYSKYRYENDDEDDHEHYREYEGDDDDEDNTRSYSRNIRKKPKKYYASESKPGSQYSKDDHYKVREGYKTNHKYSSEFKSPKEHGKSDHRGKKPKAHYKSYKYYKSSSNMKPKKEKKESIEGRQSQNVPIIHKQKLFQQEKWVVKKNDSDL